MSFKLDIPRGKFKNIAINCSGGADSALVLYLLGLAVKDGLDSNIIAVTASIADKGNNEPNVAKPVIKKVEELIGLKFVSQHLVYHVDTIDDRGDFIEDLFVSGKIDLMLSGVTRNPISDDPIYMTTASGNTMDIRISLLTDRNWKKKNNWFWSINGIDKLYDHTRENYQFYSPLNNIDKKRVVAIYHEYQIFDALFPLSRTCNASAEKTNNFTEECMDCWPCMERKWAVEQNSQKNIDK